MSKALIVDDEARARETIRNLIRLYCPSITEIHEADSSAYARLEIEKQKPDIVFLDIQMPDGTGFDLLKKYKELPFKLIFITAYDQYALQAFKFSALDYLLKPVNPDELIESVRKAEVMLARDSIASKLEVFISNMENISKESKKIVLKTSDNIYVVNVSDIIRCEADKNYSSFFLVNGKRIIVSNTLKEYDELLCPYRFFRVHQTHLVSLDHIERYEKKDGGSLVMKDGSVVPVAVRKKEDLLAVLQKQ